MHIHMVHAYFPMHHACTYQNITLLIIDNLAGRVYIRLVYRLYLGLNNTLIIPKGIET